MAGPLNKFSEEEREKITKEAEELLKEMQNLDGKTFICGTGKGIEMHRDQMEIDQESLRISEQKTRSILANQIAAFEIKKVIREAVENFKIVNIESKYHIRLDNWTKMDDTTDFITLSVQPSQETYFTSTVGLDREIELIALIISIELKSNSTQINLQVTSYFNPEIFRNVRIEYLGDFDTGTYRHSNDEYDFTLPESMNLIRSKVDASLQKALAYYFKKTS